MTPAKEELGSQDAIHRYRSLTMHRRRCVGVQIQSDRDLGMAEHVGNNLGMHSLREKQRGRGMSKVMKADSGKASPPQ